MIQQSNSEKIQNRINFSTFVHSVIFWQKKKFLISRIKINTHTAKYEPLLNKVVIKR